MFLLSYNIIPLHLRSRVKIARRDCNQYTFRNEEARASSKLSIYLLEEGIMITAGEKSQTLSRERKKNGEIR